MREQVRRWTTIPTCVGIGDTKTLAKLGNAAAKKNPLFDGVADLRDEMIRTWVLDRFPVADVWGVGGATARKLAALGILTAGKLRDMPMKQARAIGTVVLERLVAELRGVPSGAVETIEPQRKGMAVTRSFGSPVHDFDTLNLVQRVHEALSSLGDAPAEEGPQAKVPMVSIRASQKPDYLVCLECGKKQKTLRRHLQSAHGLTPEQYRADYSLPRDYPMASANYSEKRREMAKSIGLGRKKAASDAAPAKPARKPRVKKDAAPSE